MNEPKISFVCPTYNRVEWVAECIQSLRAQGEPDIEIIVVDDASTDGTDELLNWFVKADPRVRVVRNETNLGAGQSRNVGNQSARAPIIAVCDSDDVYPDDRAEKTLKAFTDDQLDGLMINTAYVRIDYWNEFKENFPGVPFDESLYRKEGSITFFCHPSAAYRTKDILAVPYRSETKDRTDDVQLVDDWIKAGKHIGFLAEHLCMHRVLPKSIMAQMRGFKPEWAI